MLPLAWAWIGLVLLASLTSTLTSSNGNIAIATCSDEASSCSSKTSPTISCNEGSICIATTAINVAFSAFKDSSITAVSFTGCTKLTSIYNYAFSRCSVLAAASFGDLKDSLTYIGNYAFESATQLATVDLREQTKLQTIGTAAFINTTAMLELSLKGCGALRAISNSAFAYAYALESIDFSGTYNLSSIGKNAFYQTTSLLLADFSDMTELTYIGSYSFYNSSLAVADFSGLIKLLTIDKMAFAHSKVIAADFTACAALTNIGDGSFFSATHLSTLDLTGAGSSSRNGGIIIGAYAFQYTKLRSVRIPATVTKISTLAFANIPTLTFVCLEDSDATNVHDDAFYDSPGINTNYITNCPTAAPSSDDEPSRSPSFSPSSDDEPSRSPSFSPSSDDEPSRSPSFSPSSDEKPSRSPSLSPSRSPSFSPSSDDEPSRSPSLSPSRSPSFSPSRSPSLSPSSGSKGSNTQPPSFKPPSSHPSARPSSRPTRRDLVRASLLDGDVTTEFLLFKIDYFLGAYACYFVLLFLLLLAADKSGWKKETVNSLTMSAYKSGLFLELLATAETTDTATGHSQRHDTGVDFFGDLLLLQIIAAQETAALVARSAAQPAEAAGSRTAKAQSAEYSADFYRYALAKRTFFGCEPLLYPQGFPSRLLGVTTAGLIEDLVTYLTNYHKILSTVFALKGSTYSRTSRRVVFLLQHVSTFSVLVLTSQILSAGKISQSRADAFQTFVIPSLSLLSNVIFSTIMRSEAARSLGHVITFTTFGVAAMALLIFASLASSSESRFALIGEYTVKIFIISNIQDLLLILLMFYPRMYFALYIGRFPVLNAGRYFVEKLLHSRHCDDSANAKSFVASSYSLFGLITVEWAYNKQGSMSAAAAKAPCSSSRLGSSVEYTANPLTLARRPSSGIVAVTAEAAGPEGLQSSTAPSPPPPPSPPPHHASPANPHAFDHSAGLATKVHALAHTTNPLLQGHHHAHPTHHHFNHHIPATEEGGSPMGITAAALHSTDESDLAHREDVLALHLRKFADDANAAYVKTVHFFQAREQGGVQGCNIDEVDMSAIEMNAVYDPYSSSAAAAAVGKRKTVVELAQMFEGSLAIS